MKINIKYFFRNFVLPKFIDDTERNISSTYVEVGTTYTAKKNCVCNNGRGQDNMGAITFYTL